MAELESSLTAMDWLPKLTVGSMTHSKDPNASLTGSLSIRKNCNDSDRSGIVSGPKSDGKPPYSYANMITFAIQSSVKKKMTLSEIYQWICDNFPYYAKAGSGWKVSLLYSDSNRTDTEF